LYLLQPIIEVHGDIPGFAKAPIEIRE